MKRLLDISICLVIMLVAVSCADGIMEPYDGNDEAGLLSVGSLDVEDFAGTSATRAVNDGATVTFENGDEMGVLLIDEEGAAFENVLFRYDGNIWQNTGGTYYSGKIGSAIAYFPYKDFTGSLPSTVNELRQTVSELTADDAGFRDRDLLVSEVEVTSPELDIRFQHAWSMIVLSGAKTLQVEGGEVFTYMLALSDVGFAIGDRRYVAEDVGGRYICIVDAETLEPDDFRYFYTVDGTSYVKTVSESKALEPNHSYSFPCITSDSGVGTGIAAGDFYCTSDRTGSAVVIPAMAADLPSGLTCHGIVFHVMDSEEFSGFATTNGLTADDYPGYEGEHGLVVSLKDGGKLGSATDFKNFMMTSVEDYGNREVMNGYEVTEAMKAAVGSTITEFTALNGHDSPVSSFSTFWYIPSFKELAILVRGGDGTEVSKEGRDIVNNQLEKISGSVLLGEGNIPSITISANEQNEAQGTVWFVTGSNGNEFSYPFDGTNAPGEIFRPILAF